MVSRTTIVRLICYTIFATVSLALVILLFSKSHSGFGSPWIIGYAIFAALIIVIQNRRPEGEGSHSTRRLRLCRQPGHRHVRIVPVRLPVLLRHREFRPGKSQLRQSRPEVAVPARPARAAKVSWRLPRSRHCVGVTLKLASLRWPPAARA